VRIEVVLSLPQDAASVPVARRVVAAMLVQTGVERDCLDDVKVALSEACTNVLDHAGSAGSYRITIALEDDLLTMDVADDGQGFVDDRLRPEMAEPLSERGRGAALIEALTDHARFDSVTTGGATAHMSKRLIWAADRPLWERRG
jgi:serine/threonine-protein kinase RsbW